MVEDEPYGSTGFGGQANTGSEWGYSEEEYAYENEAAASADDIEDMREFYADDPAMLELLAALEEGDFSGLEATAAGPGYSETCQAEISAPRTLLVTCANLDAETYSQATHRIDGDLEKALAAKLLLTSRENGAPFFSASS